MIQQIIEEIISGRQSCVDGGDLGLFVPLRFTGTGTRPRDPEGGVRSLEVWSTPEVFEMIKQTPIILRVKPDGNFHTSSGEMADEYSEIAAGIVIEPYVKDNEIWVVAKIISDEAKLALRMGASTSPFVKSMVDNKNIEIKINAIIELALVPKGEGAWDQIDLVENKLTDVIMTEELKADAVEPAEPPKEEEAKDNAAQALAVKDEVARSSGSEVQALKSELESLKEMMGKMMQTLQSKPATVEVEKAIVEEEKPMDADLTIDEILRADEELTATVNDPRYGAFADKFEMEKKDSVKSCKKKAAKYWGYLLDHFIEDKSYRDYPEMHKFSDVMRVYKDAAKKRAASMAQNDNEPVLSRLPIPSDGNAKMYKIEGFYRVIKAASRVL